MAEIQTAADPSGVVVLEQDSLLDQILQETKLSPTDDGYDVARKGVSAFISELLKPQRAGATVNSAAIDMMIAEIDQKLSAQVDEVLHNDKFKQLESVWRGLKFAVDRTDFRQNIKIEIMNVSKEDLLTDFEDSPEVVKSGLYKHIYTAEYGQFGGQPVGAVVCDYAFGSGANDVKLAQYCAGVGAMAHAPFIAGAAPAMFGVDTFEEIPNLKDMESIFEGPKYAKWNGFRESEDSRYFALAMPRFMLRTPYGPESAPVKAFNYEEKAEGKTENYLWGNAAIALGTRMTDSFANFRWCPNIIGPQAGGSVENLPLHQYEAMGEIQTKIPTEIMLTERREYELSEEGFIGLTFRKDSDNACFFSANSVQKPKFFGNTTEGKASELNYKLGTQLPYMMIVNRLAHYIKVLQRENIGSWKNRGELETELNNWIRQYVSDQENPSADVRSRRPLRKAQIVVADVEGEPGWYSVSMAVQPHFKYMGADFTLSLKGKLDKA